MCLFNSFCSLKCWLSGLFITLMVLGLVLITFAGTRRGWWKVGSGQLGATASLQKEVCCQLQAVPIPLAVYTPPGMRAVIREAIANRDRGQVRVSLRIANVGQKRLSRMEILLLDLTPGGKLANVQGQRLQIQLQPGGQQDTSLNAEFPHEAQNNLVLAVRASAEDIEIQEITMDELVHSLIELRTKSRVPNLLIRNRQHSGERVNPNFCYDVFRLAHAVPADLIIGPISSSRCYQYEHRFSVSFKQRGGNR